MSSRFLSLIFVLALSANARTLRVCADPDNLPFSNRAGEGFENRLAQNVAHDLNAALEYHWWPGRAHSVERSLNAGECDLLFGVPAGMDGVLLTKPYYKSSYVFVSRRDRGLALSSLLDSRLAQYRIGVQVVGDDYAPPAIVLARRGLAANIVGFRLFGAKGESNPQARILDAVRLGEVDVAIVWGPVAGYFTRAHAAEFQIDPVNPPQFAGIPFTFAVSAAVRPGETVLQKQVDRALAHACRSTQALLSEYRVPLVVEEEVAEKEVAEEDSRCATPPSSPLALR